MKKETAKKVMYLLGFLGLPLGMGFLAFMQTLSMKNADSSYFEELYKRDIVEIIWHTDENKTKDEMLHLYNFITKGISDILTKAEIGIISERKLHENYFVLTLKGKSGDTMLSMIHEILYAKNPGKDSTVKIIYGKSDLPVKIIDLKSQIKSDL